MLEQNSNPSQTDSRASRMLIPLLFIIYLVQKQGFLWAEKIGPKKGRLRIRESDGSSSSRSNEDRKSNGLERGGQLYNDIRS